MHADSPIPSPASPTPQGAAGAAFASPRWEDADAALPVSLEAALTSAAELDAGEASPAAEEAPAAPVPADPIATACALPTAELSADAVAAPPAISTATSCCAEEAECAAPAGTATWLEEPCFVLELESRPPAAATHEPRCATAPALDCCADASTATASTPAGCAAVASPAKEGSAATDLVAASAPAVLPAASPARTTRRLCYALGALAGLSSGMLVALRLRKRCG